MRQDATPAAARDGARHRHRTVLAALAGTALALATLDAIAAFWVCDDAFVSFRYARNLVEGDGLVFNAGERVEGFTNLLWTLWVAAGLALGGDAATVAQVSGLLAWLGGALLLLRCGPRIAAPPAGGAPAVRDGGRSAPLAVAGLGWLACAHGRVFASGGLETALFTLLVTAMLVVAIGATRLSDFACAGLLGSLAALTRPDGLLPYGILGLYCLGLLRHLGWRPAAALLLPGVAVLGPVIAWKWSYYGTPVPNTFHAKSAASPYPGQGLYYVALFFETYWILVPALVLPWVVAVRRRAALAAPGWGGGRAPLLLATVPLAYLLYVVWVGGDFMFARFVLPVVPALYLALELPRHRWPGLGFGLALAAAVAGGTLASSPPEALRGAGLRGIVEERSKSPPEFTRAMRWIGGELARKTAGVDLRVLVFGGQAILAYHGRFGYVLEGSAGLTDTHLARLDIDERGRPGHEKSAARDPEYVFGRGIDVSFNTEPLPDPIGELRRIDFGVIGGTILCYRREVLAALAARGARFADFTEHLDAYLDEGLEHRPRAELERDYRAFSDYYFRHNDDPEREAPFRRALGG